jgi:hypothetical protein
MKIVLTMIFCSAMHNMCQDPVSISQHNSWYDCMNTGYQEALDKTKQIGRQTVNKELIYIKFTCKELREA